MVYRCTCTLILRSTLLTSVLREKFAKPVTTVLRVCAFCLIVPWCTGLLYAVKLFGSVIFITILNTLPLSIVFYLSVWLVAKKYCHTNI